MMAVPERLTSVTHPLVSSMYLKKGYGDARAVEDVLIIETNFSHETEDDDVFESHMIDLLGDLRALQTLAEKQIGHFDRVDIRTS